jgi:asparagine synthase (glutamine-hydrolysing)
MVLSGDGGDELFAGYTSYPHLLWSQRKPAALHKRLRHAVGGAARRAKLLAPSESPEDFWYGNTTYYNEPLRARLWRPEFRSLMPSTRAWYDEQFRLAPADDLLSRFQYVDVNGYLVSILAKVDVASMCHSLEVRVPLIDHAFTDVISRIPARLKVHRPGGGDTLRDDVPYDAMRGKYLLKKTAERFFPREFLHRRKRGFDVPIRNWLSRGAHDETRERLLGSARLEELFAPELMTEMLATEESRSAHGWRLWALLFLDEWLAQHASSRRGALRS